MHLKNWTTLKEQITELIEENTKNFSWNNYQFFYGENPKLSVLITMDKLQDGETKKVIIRGIAINPANDHR